MSRREEIGADEVIVANNGAMDAIQLVYDHYLDVSVELVRRFKFSELEIPDNPMDWAAHHAQIRPELRGRARDQGG